MRTFVAIPIPFEGPARRFLEACQGRLKQASGDVRWTTPDQWHITLRFLGETSEEQVPALQEAVEKAARKMQPFEVRQEGWGVFPERGKPRVIWAGVKGARWADDGYRGFDLAYLHRFTDAAVRHSGFSLRREDFRPHITLARVKPPKDIGPLLNILRNEPPPPDAAFTATRVTLFQSGLSPHGSTYTPLLEATLGK
jgi:2'-5' RNA ligase